MFWRLILIFLCAISVTAMTAAKESMEIDSSDASTIQKKNEKDDSFPSTLEGFGYKFNKEEKLVQISSGKPFDFHVSDSDIYNQRHYEALGEVLNEEVYNLLEKDAKLKRLTIPINPEENEPSTFIFASEDALTNPDRLLILIHGSGVVRAGQWARRLIINDSLKSGTQLPFIKRAMKEGYGVLVLNTNDNFRIIKDLKVKIRGSESPEKHTVYVWENFIKPAAARHVAIIAHSYGGVCTVHLVQKCRQEMQGRVFAVALTDSVHSIENQGLTETDKKWLASVGRNWVSSNAPFDEPVIVIGRYEVPRHSAGTMRHELTSWNCFEPVFQFLEERYNQVTHRKVKSDL